MQPNRARKVVSVLLFSTFESQSQIKTPEHCQTFDPELDEKELKHLILNEMTVSSET